MLSKQYPSSRTVLLVSCVALMGIFALMLIASYASASSATAQFLWLRGSRNLRPIPTCSDVGLCREGERSLILDSAGASAIADAQRKGCRVHRTLQSGAVLRCPSSVSIPYAYEERALRLSDVYSNIQIEALPAHEGNLTGKGVRVAILDTGIESQHPELSGRVVLAKNFTTDSDEDKLGHGTHVAGILAGAGVREFQDRGSTNRVLGVTPQVDILSGKVCNDQGWCLEGDVQAGIEWAVAQKARVINLSLGGGAFLDHCDRDSLAKRVNWAVEQGTVVVAASGNSGDSSEGVSTPACASKAIAVGAVDHQDVRPSWSSYGYALDVTAPGAGILSSVSCLAAGTCPNPAYGWWSGTSMATPHTAGLVALLLQFQPSLTPSQVYATVTGTAEDLGDKGFDRFYGYGRINVHAALVALGFGQAEEEAAASSAPVQEDENTPAQDDAQEDSRGREQQREQQESGRADSGRYHEAPAALPPLPPQAAPAAQENRPAAPRGSPRW